ncbi:single-stranded DNA-binding protein [Sporosarcina sp. FSL K6-3457]|uniref:single-stranded DNA-binding protein n=1 Tax=Sporosarcina sp. FSL K6-3457 TaxID=2978204 RepID=UPI0030F9399D
MINRVVLVGRMTRDPEVKYSQSGVAMCRFSIAVNRTFKNASGETEADFPNILTFKKTAENVANFLKKGSLVGIDGRIQTGSYEKDGVRVYTTEILADSVQFLEPRNSNAENTSSNQSNGRQAPWDTNTPNYQRDAQNRSETTSNDPFSTGGGTVDPSDDLPF